MVRNTFRRNALCIGLAIIAMRCAPGHDVPTVSSNGNPNTSPGTTPSSPAAPAEQPAAPATPQHVRLGLGNDPSMVYFQNKYYLVQSDFAQHVTLLRSSRLSQVMRDETFTYTDTVDGDFNSEAPDIDVVTDPRDGVQKLAIYITKALPFPGTIKVLLTADPAQGFEDMGFLANVGGYDAHYMVHPNGKQYLFYSNFATLNIIAMVTPWTTSGIAVPIATATLPWETQDGSALNEAPAHVISGDRLNLVYSANPYNHPDYLCGLLTASVAADPLDPSQWHKHADGPVFTTANGNLGPGSGTFFSDGNNTWWGYKSFTDPNNFNPEVRVQTIVFDANGTVQLGSPL